MGVDTQAEVVAGNEALFRRVNEAIERGVWPGEQPSAFRCECARSGCAELLSLTHEKYEAVRSNPRRFIVVPGHEDSRFEDVVERDARWAIVEKRGQAGALAEAADPRS